MSERGRVEHLNPEELPRNPAFTQVVAVSGPVTTVLVGGQNGVTASGEIAGTSIRGVGVLLTSRPQASTVCPRAPDKRALVHRATSRR